MNEKKINLNYNLVLLYFLALFLPLYAFLNAYVNWINMVIFVNIINYIRDFAIILCFILTIMKNGRFSLRYFNKTEKSFYFGIILLLLNYIYGFFISIINGYSDLAIKGIHLNIIPILLVFIIAECKNIKYNDLDKFNNFFINIAFIISIIGIYFYIFRPNIYGQLFLVFANEDINKLQFRLTYTRMVSTFLSPNVFGTYMGISILLAFNKLIIYRKGILINFIKLALFFICLFLSGSRGAWGFTFIGMVTLTLLNKYISRTKKYKMVLFALLFVILMFSILPILINSDYFINRFYSIFDFGNSSSYGRISIWKQAFTVLKNYLFFGLGLGVSSINSLGNIELESLGVYVIDGYYAKILIETGVFGFLCFIVYAISIIIFLVNSYKVYNNSIHILTLAIFMGFLVQSIGSNVFDFVNIAPFLWIYLGFSLRIHKNQKMII